MPRLIDQQQRLACSAADCSFVHWDNPVPVVAAMVQWQGQFVLARNAQWSEGLFSMITGFLEKAEQPEVAVLRETQEELGLIGEQALFLGHYALPKFNQLIIAYLVTASGTTIQLNEELVEFKLLSRQALEHYDFGRFELVAKIAARALQLLPA